MFPSKKHLKFFLFYLFIYIFFWWRVALRDDTKNSCVASVSANLSVVVYEVRLSQKNLLHDVILRVGGQITLVLFPRIIFRSLTGGKSGSKRTSKVLTLSRLKEIQIIHCPRRHQSYIGWRQV